MHVDVRLADRHRKRLIVALVAAPLLIASPTLWAHAHEPGFFVHNLDELLIFIAIPLACALLLARTKPRD